MHNRAALLITGIIGTVVGAAAADLAHGETIFRTSCWGCHHPTAEAFGPSFRAIAARRTTEEIKAQIVRPDVMYAVLGYRRNAMPPFAMAATDLEDITAYIVSFK